MKSKTKHYSVTITLGEGESRTYLVRAASTVQAKRFLMDALEMLVEAELATGEQLYAAGVSGQKIIGAPDTRSEVERAQMPLPVIPMTAEQEAEHRLTPNEASHFVHEQVPA